MTWGLMQPFNKDIFNLPTSTHDCCSLSQRQGVWEGSDSAS